MDNPNRGADEQLSVLRILEVALAFSVLALIVGCWAYGWIRGSGLLTMLWYYSYRG